MTDIDVKNYDPGDFVPRGIVNLVEGRQLPSAADQPWKVCLVGASLFPEDDGDPLAPANMPVRVSSEKPAETSDTTTEAPGTSAVELFGGGSELHLMCRAAFRAYPGVELWAVPIEVPDETGYEKATATLTVAGTAARPGEWTIVIHDTPVAVRIEDEADPQATLEAIAAALELQADLPVLPGAITDGDVPSNDGGVCFEELGPDHAPGRGDAAWLGVGGVILVPAQKLELPALTAEPAALSRECRIP